MARVAIVVAIGSNLGDRASHIQFARERLDQLLLDGRFSPVIETEPVGLERGAAPQRRYLNAVAVGATELGARDLLDRLLAIERERGRVRPAVNAPRTLDLDLILYGDLVMAEPGLTIPHPRFRQRAFVLGPLAALAPDVVDPETGKTIVALLSELARAGVSDTEPRTSGIR